MSKGKAATEIVKFIAEFGITAAKNKFGTSQKTGVGKLTDEQLGQGLNKFEAKKIEKKAINILVSKDIRKAVGKVAKKFYPKQPKNIIAVTGTNGKTSIVDFLGKIWKNDKICIKSTIDKPISPLLTWAIVSTIIRCNKHAVSCYKLRYTTANCYHSFQSGILYICVWPCLFCILLKKFKKH